MSIKLLPCPFCGAEAEIKRLGDAHRSTQYECTDCGASLETGEEWDHGRDWNKRANLDTELLASMKAERDEADRRAGSAERHNENLEEVLGGHRLLVRQLDVAMHGEAMAARQASLCDLIPLAEELRAKHIAAEARAEKAEALLERACKGMDAAANQLGACGFPGHADGLRLIIKACKEQSK